MLVGFSLFIGCDDGLGQTVAGSTKKLSASASTHSVMKQRITTLQRRVCFILTVMLISAAFID